MSKFTCLPAYMTAAERDLRESRRGLRRKFGLTRNKIKHRTPEAIRQLENCAGDGERRLLLGVSEMGECDE